MSRYQWAIISTSVIVLVVMAFFPPWAYVVQLHVHPPDGYHWIFYEQLPSDTYEVRVNYDRLAKQYAFVVVVSSLLLYVLRKRANR